VLVGNCKPGLAGTRDRAILLVGQGSAMRRSELASLNVDDLAFDETGLTIQLRQYKGCRNGEVREILIPANAEKAICPVQALRDWLADAGLTNGPVFRYVRRGDHLEDRRLSGHAIALVIKRYAAGDYSGMSLRSGFVTQAALDGVPDLVIMAQTGHRSIPMVLRYLRLNKRS